MSDFLEYQQSNSNHHCKQQNFIYQVPLSVFYLFAVCEVLCLLTQHRTHRQPQSL